MSKVLVIDDEKYVCEGLKNALNWESLGFDDVLLAENGKEAVEIIKHNKIELVISDVKMPIMDGIQLARYISKFYPDIRMIFISAYDEFQYAKQAIDYGVRCYLLKPVERDVLQETIIRVMNIRNAAAEYESVRLDTEDVNTILIRKVQQYIKDNFDRKISLEEVARQMYISPQYLCKKFKKLTGQQFVDYVLGIKIRKAKSMLMNSNIKVKDIATKLGFTDYTYFCKVFKKYENMTPLQYRANFALMNNRGHSNYTYELKDNGEQTREG